MIANGASWFKNRYKKSHKTKTTNVTRNADKLRLISSCINFLYVNNTSKSKYFQCYSFHSSLVVRLIFVNFWKACNLSKLYTYSLTFLHIAFTNNSNYENNRKHWRNEMKSLYPLLPFFKIDKSQTVRKYWCINEIRNDRFT